jgi:tetratricopeptide (TPR) repeat protein
VAAPRFAVSATLAPPVLDPFLDRVAARPDAGAPAIRDLIDYARAAGVEQLAVPDELAAGQPVAAFLEGLTLLGRNQLDPAARAFRGAMRLAPDLYPAMFYLGACYAAGGRDKDAAAAWRTALIKEGDNPVIHLLLTDALLRQQQVESALGIVDAARRRWPTDDALKRRFVVAALSAGRYADGLQVLDELVDTHADDEPTLVAGLLVLYESFEGGRPVEGVEEDRARMARLADAYRGLGGPSVALVDTWVEAARRR